MHFLFAVALGAALSDFAVAQLPPTPQGITTIKSKYNNDITISYKEVRLLASEKESDLPIAQIITYSVRVDELRPRKTLPLSNTCRQAQR